MVATIYTVSLKPNGEEKLQRGTELFPCSAYRGDVQQYLPGYLSMHWHKELEFFVLESGKVRIPTGTEEFELNPGDGYFTNSGALHGIYPQGDMPCQFHSMVFDASILSGRDGSVFDMNYVRPFLENGFPMIPIYKNESSTKLLNEFEEAFACCEEERPDYEFEVRTHLSRMFLALRQMHPLSPAPSASIPIQRIKIMIQWIKAHYDEPVTVSQIAASAGISIRECQRSFREIVHTTPMHYTLNYRLTIAAELLKNTGTDITAIAASCGIDNSSYFSKQFKILFGATPTQYRKKCQEKR